MTRKLIQLSPSTIVVYLPKQWVDKNKLKKGAEVNLEEANNNLVISTDTKKTKSTITIDIKKLSRDLLWRYIDAVYIAGYDDITIITENNKQSAMVNTALRYFPGFMLFSEEKNILRVKDITGDNKEDITKVMDRIFNMIINMIQQNKEALVQKDWEQLLNAKKPDYTINSYCSYCFRQLNKFGAKEFSKTSLLHTYIKLIEMLSDKIAALFVALGKAKKIIPLKIVEEIEAMCKDVQKIHTNYSKEKLLGIEKRREKITTLIGAKQVPYELRELQHLLHDIEEVEIQLNL